MSDFHDNREMRQKSIQANIAGMPSLSTTVVKVLQTCNDPNASANHLQRVISLDPVLTARVLKLINSAYYSLGKPILSLTRAIIMLGLNTVKNLALSFAVIDAFKVKAAGQSFTVDEFWRHSLGVGVVAKYLAALTGSSPEDRETYFVAGLLHDLGKLPLLMQFPVDYDRVCQAVRSGSEALHRHEARCLGLDHGTVGGIVAQKWQLGPTLADALSHHHNPADGSQDSREFLTVIALANQLALYLNIGNAGDYFADHPTMTALMNDIDIDWTMLTDLHTTASDEIERAKFFLEVVQHDSRH